MTVIQRDTAGLTGDQLDAAVAHVLGVPTFHPPRTMSERHTIGFRGQPFRPSSDWADGGPIIEREKIAVYHDGDCGWKSSRAWIAGYRLCIDEGFRGSELTGGDEPSIDLDHAVCGPTPLVAAMRAFVMAKFGRTVEIPA